MSIRSKVVFSMLVSFSLAAALNAQVTRNDAVALKNWPAPLYWQPSQAENDAAAGKTDSAIRPPSPEAATPVGSLVFVAMTPCRVVDTRASSGFPSGFGQPSLSNGVRRDFPIQSSTLCTIPSNAQAYSFNVTVVPPGSLGFLTLWPEGVMQPVVVTIDDVPGDIRNNGAIVPAGTPNGGVSAITNATTDLVLDINGYYAPSTGITLAQGTVSAPSLSFSGDVGTGLFSSGAGTLNFTSAGTTALTIQSNGNLNLTGNILQGGALFLHDLGGTSNLGVGIGALAVNTGTNNTASGNGALASNTSGGSNTASGISALNANTTGANNTASGNGALLANINGSENTASGQGALLDNTSGSSNTATGAFALASETTGAFNSAFGANAGRLITTGNNNIDIGNEGTSSDGIATNTGVIRIGTSGTQTTFFAAGISGVTAPSGVEVFIGTGGQLGTVVSSRRYKEDIQDMNDASSGLLRLRPVTYRYQQPYADGSKPIDYGLIAEEVADVYPDLVVKDADGRVQSVQYHKLVPMLLNELQKERQERSETVQSLQAQVSALQKALETLMTR